MKHSRIVSKGRRQAKANFRRKTYNQQGERRIYY